MKAAFIVRDGDHEAEACPHRGHEPIRRPPFHTWCWDYEYTGANLENLGDKVVGIIGTGASAVQIISPLGEEVAKERSSSQRTPSSIDIRPDS